MAVVSSVLQVVCDEGVVGAAPSLWVVVVVRGQYTQCLFMPLHISDGRLYLRIRVTVSHWALLWWDLLRFHDGCTEDAGGPIELL